MSRSDSQERYFGNQGLAVVVAGEGLGVERFCPDSAALLGRGAGGVGRDDLHECSTATVVASAWPVVGRVIWLVGSLQLPRQMYSALIAWSGRS